MKKIFLVFLCALPLSITASHIVGGEFELLYKSNYFYRVNLIMYFDEVNGEPGNKIQDRFITAKIFRVSDNAFIDTVRLKLLNETPVNFTQPACDTIKELKTSKQFYSNINKYLSPDVYNDPQGYYIVWERCCRNYFIKNIFSDAPDIPNAIPAGQTFYLMFPPVIKNGQPFINSSVKSFKPLSDYACPNKPYYADFSGENVDVGDVIVYSVVEPLSTSSGDPYPPILPEPYPKVTWFPPFGFNNIMGGTRNLKITPNGFLTVTPGNVRVGLYVFAVKCEEFRGGQKIGESRRDFQLYVRECQTDVPPQIVGKKNGDATFTSPNAPLNVTFKRTLTNRCLELEVSDGDAPKGENITIRAIPIDFTEPINFTFNKTTAILTNDNQKAQFELCFDQCPPVNRPFKIGVLAFDDACALPLGDTLYVTVNIEIPQDTNPPEFFNSPNINDVLTEGQEKFWPIQVVDPGGDDAFTVVANPKGFKFEDFGMAFNIIQQTASLYNAKLFWNTKCKGYDFSTKTNFDIDIILTYVDSCKFTHHDTMTFKLKVIALGDPPIIYSSLDADKKKRIIKVYRRIYDNLNFLVTGEEKDTDLILRGNGLGFASQDYGINFQTASGNGLVTSPFNWRIPCVDLAIKDTFDIRFIVIDIAGVCKIYQADTLDVIVKLLPPLNNIPTLNISNLDINNPLVSNALSIELGQQLSLVLTGNDRDVNPLDSIEIKLIDATGNVLPEGYEFIPAKGVSPLIGSLTWNPDCSIFENNIYENNYTFTFKIADDRCFNAKADTIPFNLTIHDVVSNTKDFLPTNFITPNGDGCNDYFAMEEIEIENTKCPAIGGKDPDKIVGLPKDNCTGRFVGIQIYDRWGKEVFISNKRNFRWYAKDVEVGVYFYYLNYSNHRYKGTVTVRL